MTLDILWRGSVPYRRALDEQRAHRDLVIEGQAPQSLWLLEHPPVITTGRRSLDAPLDTAAIRAAGFDLVETERGGLATCHEPGQLVGYLFFDASTIGVRRTVEAVEDGIIAWLGELDVHAGRRDGYPGIWIGSGKICAIGLHVKRGVTMHGFALNLTNDKRGFGLIVPCGIPDAAVLTLQDLLGAGALKPEAAAPSVGAALAEALRSAGLR